MDKDLLDFFKFYKKIISICLKIFIPLGLFLVILGIFLMFST